LQSEENLQWIEYRQTHLNFDQSMKLLEERTESADRFFSEFRRTYYEGL
jgi:hypothetical protein